MIITDIFMLAGLIWDIEPIVFSAGALQLRWSTLFLIVGILLGRFLLFRNFKKNSQSLSDTNLLFYVTLLGALVGARLFYFVLFDPAIFYNNPLYIFFPLTFKGGLKLEGLGQFSLSGGFIGMWIVLFLYSKIRQVSFLEVFRNGLLVFLVLGFFVLLGNFFHSENYGTETDAPTGVQFVNRIQKKLLQTSCCIMRIPNGKNPLDSAIIRKGKTIAHQNVGYHPILIYLFFTEGATEMLVNEFLIGDVKSALYEMRELVYEPGDEPLHYTIFEEGKNLYTARIQSIVIARHPIQLYGAIVLLIALVILLGIRRKKESVNYSQVAFLGAVVALIFFGFGFLRHDKGVILPFLSISLDQIAWILILVFSFSLVWKQKKQKGVSVL